MSHTAEGRNRLRVLAEAALLGAATGLRLYALSLKPLHHDEGVNGLFLLKLFREGIYRYDAANYHGPTLCCSEGKEPPQLRSASSPYSLAWAS